MRTKTITEPPCVCVCVCVCRAIQFDVIVYHWKNEVVRASTHFRRRMVRASGKLRACEIRGTNGRASKDSISPMLMNCDG